MNAPLITDPLGMDGFYFVERLLKKAHEAPGLIDRAKEGRE
jgi:hypothetical protein